MEYINESDWQGESVDCGCRRGDLQVNDGIHLWIEDVINVMIWDVDSRWINLASG